MQSMIMTNMGQLTIPEAVRQQLGLRQGTKVTFVVEGDHAACSTRAQHAGALKHLLASPHVEVEDRLSVRAALLGHRDGLDFADALHHASYRTGDAMASFDDRKFARRADKLGSVPGPAARWGRPAPDFCVFRSMREPACPTSPPARSPPPQ